MPHGVMHEPRLHYRNIEEGLDWCNEILSCLTMLTFALEDSDIGANMDPEHHWAI